MTTKKTTKTTKIKKVTEDAPVKVVPAKIERHFSGEVVSTGMTKTIVVRVDSVKMNEKYQKKYKTSRKYHVHDEKNIAKVGEMVNFVECRPLSKTKRWRLVESVKK